MIEFICQNIDVEKLKETVKKSLIRCVAKAVEPVYGNYERTGLDYSSCKSKEEMRLVFAEHHLGEIYIEELDDGDGIVLYDELDVEGTLAHDNYDLEQFLLDVQKEFPDLEVSGSGDIDYHFAMTGYEIFTENGVIRVEYNEE